MGANRQGTLSGYFDTSVGSGTFAPRQRQPYTSKRLQKVVSDFRKAKEPNRESTPSRKGKSSKNKATDPLQSSQEEGEKGEKGEKEEKAGKKGTRKRTKVDSGKSRKATKKRRVEKEESASSEEENQEDKMDIVPDRPLRVQLRARKGQKPSAVIEDSSDESQDPIDTFPSQ